MNEIIASKGIKVVSAASEAIKNPDKFSKLFGIAFPFVGLKKAAVDTYVEEIRKSDLSPENKMLAIINTKRTLTELLNQAAVIEKAYGAATEGTDFSMNSAVKDEWLSRFLDAAKHVSEEDAQLLWGNVLAGEFENPGSAPASIVRILTELTTEYAEAFSNLCSMTIKLAAVNDQGFATEIYEYLIVPNHDDWPEGCASEINLRILKELESLNLIHCGERGYERDMIGKGSKELYCLCEEKTLVICGRQRERFPIGVVILTSSGEYLKRFMEPKPVEGYYPAIVSFFKRNNVSVKEVAVTIEEVEGPEKDTAIRFQRINTEQP